MAAAIVGDPVLGADDPILGSKHDFTGLNARAGVVAMSGVAFSDYGYSCVYCHIPPEEAGANPADFGGIDGWNRYVPALSNYNLYDSPTLDNKTNSLRALVKYLDNMTEEEIIELNIPTGTPLVYELNNELKPLRHYYLGDQEAIKKAMDSVANQGKAK